MTYSRFVKSFLLVIPLFLVLTAAVNIRYDVYDVFNSAFTSEQSGINSNQRFNKMNMIIDNPAFNAFFFGSSRLGYFEAVPLNQAFKSHNDQLVPYNFGVFSGTPKDYLAVLKHLKSINRPIDHVLVGFDLYAFEPDLSKPEFRHHFHVTGQSPAAFYMGYLFEASFVYLATNFDYYFQSAQHVYEHNYETGTYTPHRLIASLQNDPTHWQRQENKAKSLAESLSGINTFLSLSQRQEITDLIDFLETNQIDYKAFIQPMHDLNKSFFTEPELDSFFSYIASVTKESFIDLSPLDCLMHRNDNFYDYMHYNEDVAVSILDLVYSNLEPSCP